MKAARPPLRHRPLQTVLPYAPAGLECILAVTWDCDDRADDKARVVAVSLMPGPPAPLGSHSSAPRSTSDSPVGSRSTPLPKVRSGSRTASPIPPPRPPRSAALPRWPGG
jgi:hypothetical protein